MLQGYIEAKLERDEFFQEFAGCSTIEADANGAPALAAE